MTGETKDLMGSENQPSVDEDKKDKKDSDEALEPELLKRLPPDAKKVVEIGMGMMMQGVGPVPNPLTKKITEKHIDKILEIAAKDDERTFENAKNFRIYMLIYILSFIGLFVFLTIFLVGSDKELYKEVLKLFATFLGGLGSGFGVKSYMDNKN